VVSFPKTSIDPSRVDEEEIEDRLELLKQYHIQETIEIVIPSLFNQLEIAGFLSEDDIQDMKDGAFIVESIRSLMSKRYDLYHPFQKIADNLFYSEPSDPFSLKIKESLTIKFNSKKGES
jgi:hypothetical protein